MHRRTQQWWTCLSSSMRQPNMWLHLSRERLKFKKAAKWLPSGIQLIPTDTKNHFSLALSQEACIDKILSNSVSIKWCHGWMVTMAVLIKAAKTRLSCDSIFALCCWGWLESDGYESPGQGYNQLWVAVWTEQYLTDLCVTLYVAVTRAKRCTKRAVIVEEWSHFRSQPPYLVWSYRWWKGLCAPAVHWAYSCPVK